MGMGIVSDSDFDSEFNKLNPHLTPVLPKNRERVNETPSTIIKEVEKGRGAGNIEVPNALRNIIGQTAIEAGRQEALELAQRFGISASSASAYANGATSTTSYHERPNAGVINQTKDKIAKRARQKLALALNHITKDRLESATLKDVSGVAKDMSIIARNMDTSNDSVVDTTKNGPTFVFYSPQVTDEKKFEKIVTKE
jgi:hypothetical protein